MNVAVIDYGVGNLRSLRRGLERAGATVSETSDPAEIAAAEALVLPGVGAFRECMDNSEPFHDVIVDAAEDTPILGICVGYQLMFSESEEGADGDDLVEGLDLISGRVERLPDGEVKIPHIGWNTLSVESDHPIADGIADGDYAYFVHSYCAAADDAVASCDYGGRFAAIGANDAGNVVGTQFHPEKSGETGLKILRNFVRFAAEYNDQPVPTAAD